MPGIEYPLLADEKLVIFFFIPLYTLYCRQTLQEYKVILYALILQGMFQATLLARSYKIGVHFTKY